jgi:hypothetical protein
VKDVKKRAQSTHTRTGERNAAQESQMNRDF